MIFEQMMKNDCACIESYLDQSLSVVSLPYQKLIDAMRYSLLAGGKRLRPILVLAFCRMCGGNAEKAVPIACGVEMLHTYSLIHDDLPCMDDDDLRRGKPSNHRVFGEYTATLAGDALQAMAFEHVLQANLPAECVLRCAKILSVNAGAAGICGGQQIDMDLEGQTLDYHQLISIHRRKTSALIEASCLMGVAAANGTQEQENAAQRYAQALGLAFQIRDDMLDVIGDEKIVGKPIGSDQAEGKTTFVDLLGLSGCEREIDRLTQSALFALEAFDDSLFLQTLTKRLVIRTS